MEKLMIDDASIIYFTLGKAGRGEGIHPLNK